jgi:hypothetical protein
VRERKLKENVDYVVDSQGRFVFTRRYLLKRGVCCGNGCVNCPYGKKKGSTVIQKSIVDEK